MVGALCHSSSLTKNVTVPWFVGKSIYHIYAIYQGVSDNDTDASGIISHIIDIVCPRPLGSAQKELIYINTNLIFPYSYIGPLIPI